MKSRLARLFLSLAIVAAIGATRLPAQIVSDGFEDGTLQGWAPFGSPTLTNTTEAAHTGTHSLKTTNRTATFNGPSLDLRSLLLPNATYQISGWARMVSGTDTVKFTIQHGSGSSFNGVAQAAADANGWVQLQGTFTPTTGDSVLTLYLESNTVGTEYYLDDVTITEVSPPPTPVLIDNFEDGTTQGWRPRFGSPIVTNTTEIAHTGANSLKTTNRTQAFNGPALDLGSVLMPDNIYQIDGWVRLVAGQTLTSPVQLKLSMQEDFSDGTASQFIQVAGSQTVTDTAWVHLQGSFTFTGTNVSALTLYAESNSNGATAEFYLDDVTVALAVKVPPPFTPPGPPIATGQPKFLGCAYSPAQAPNFDKYFNQVTPENSGKWGSVEAVRGTFDFTQLDAAYNEAKNNGFLFRMHNLIWGAQQPSWIESLPADQQLQEIKNWFAAVAARYPNIDFIDVVNEPLHTPPSGVGTGNYINALGGSGTTGWDWVITSFQLARQYFPNAKLELNEFGVENDSPEAQRYIQIIQLLQQQHLIDAIGVQGHAFNTNVPASTLTANLDLLAATGLPIYITEMDVDGPTDDIQLASYQRIFPAFWNHPDVQGVTLWGYRPGLFRNAQSAFIVYDNGAERPAMKWLQTFVHNFPLIATQPQDVTVPLGGTATFSVLVGPVPSPTYQWLKDGQVIDGATDSTLTIANVRASDLGSYEVVVTNDIYSNTSCAAMLSIASLALSRHAPNVSSAAVEGSIQQMLGESVALNGNAAITGSLFVPGTPKVTLNGSPTYSDTIDGTGSTSPSGYAVTLNRGTSLSHVVRRTDPISLPTVAAPAAPTGTRNVVLNNAGQNVGDWSTVRNLTLNSNAGQVAVPAGAYGSFLANRGTAFVLGTADATAPTVYSFQSLALNSGAQIQVVGPVIVVLENSFTVNSGVVGDSDHPAWLTLDIHSGGLTLNSGVNFFGYVSAPAGQITLNGTVLLEGDVAADRLTLNSGAILQLPGPATN
jgi:GH35 family endo-1,4-beta-xylanase